MSEQEILYHNVMYFVLKGLQLVLCSDRFSDTRSYHYNRLESLIRVLPVDGSGFIFKLEKAASRMSKDDLNNLQEWLLDCQMYHRNFLSEYDKDFLN